VFVAVDIGNSKVDVLLLTEQGRITKWLRGGRLVPDELSAAITASRLHAMLDNVAKNVVASWFGVAGVDFPDQAETLRVALLQRRIFGDVEVANDIEALVHLTDVSADTRIAVVLGAGMNAIGISHQTEVRFPALGALSGDLGGGGVIGRAAVIAACRSADGRAERSSLEQLVTAHFNYPDTQTMSRALVEQPSLRHKMLDLVPIVFQEARRGDVAATTIVCSQAQEIVSTLQAIACRLQVNLTKSAIIGGGSVLRYGRDLLEPVIRASLEGEIMLEVPDLPPVVGAAKHLLQTHGIGTTIEALGAQMTQLQPEITS